MYFGLLGGIFVFLFYALYVWWFTLMIRKTNEKENEEKEGKNRG